MKRLMLAIAMAAVAQAASADPIGWDYQALPVVLAHPEFFGGGDQQQFGAADGGWQGQQDSDGPNGHGSLLPDNLSTSRQDDGGTQSGGQNHGHNGPDQHTWIGLTELTGGDTLSSGAGATLEIADITVVNIDAAPIPEPASLMLVLSALGVALASRRGRYPARRYCTASSRRNR
jgi:hypothetical protein